MFLTAGLFAHSMPAGHTADNVPEITESDTGKKLINNLAQY